MRIVGGTWRGARLKTLEGRDVTRPTTDRMREAFASMVLSAFGLDLGGVSVLDAFAGSGALGLEMLSRGASRCTFVEVDRAAYACLSSNVRSLGLGSDVARTIRGDAFRLARRGSLAGAPFGLVLLDPPYATDAARLDGLVRSLADAGALAQGAVILHERSREGDGLSREGLRLVSSREHAATAADVYVADQMPVAALRDPS